MNKYDDILKMLKIELKLTLIYNLLVRFIQIFEKIISPKLILKKLL